MAQLLLCAAQGGRPHQEDGARAQILSKDTALIALCDGMGGMENGSAASRKALAVLFSNLSDLPISDPMAPFPLLTEWLRRTVTLANITVCALARKKSERPAGTTMTAAWVQILPDTAAFVHLAHLGDSRAYRYNTSHDVWERLTEDDSRLGRQMREANVFEESLYNGAEAFTYWREQARIGASRLANGLGMSFSESTPTYSSVILASGDRLLLCSDGFWSTFSALHAPKDPLDFSLLTAVQSQDNLQSLVNKTSALSRDNACAALLFITDDFSTLLRTETQYVGTGAPLSGLAQIKAKISAFGSRFLIRRVVKS